MLIALSMVLACPVLADDTPTPWPTETPTPTSTPTRTPTPTATGTIPTATATGCPALTFNTDEPIYYPGIPFDEQMIRHIERINVNERNMTECSSDPVEHWMEGMVIQVQTTPPAAPPPGFTRFYPQGTGLYQITSAGVVSAILQNNNTPTPTQTVTVTPTPTVTPTGTPHYHALGTFSNIAVLDADGYLYVGYSSQTSATIGIPMPAAGSITGISVSCTTSGYAGGDRIDFECRLNGTNVYEVRVTPDGTGDDSTYTTQAVGTDTFVAGDIIAVYVDLQGSPPRLSKAIVTIWGTW